MSNAPRRSIKLSDSLLHQLNLYALGATAAGVGVLALAQPAEAKIVYTPKNVKFVNQSFSIDLNHDAKNDFLFSFRYGTDHYLSVKSARKGNGAISGGQQLVRGIPRLTAGALPEGTVIGPSKKFVGKPQILGAVYYNSDGGQTYFYGKFTNVGAAYVGLRFQIKGKQHYGWARLNITIPNGNGNLNYPPITAQLTGYAYETIPSKPIIAGKTKGPDMITLQPTMLGHLARGASAIPAWRAQNSAR